MACSEINGPQQAEEIAVVDEQPDRVPGDETTLLSRVDKIFKGDLTQIQERRLIRVLVSYSKSNFFFEGGTARGFEYEMLSEYEKFLNKSFKNKYYHTRMVFIPLPFDQLLAALADGRGDIAAAGLTITQEREKQVSFTHPYLPNVHEVVVVNRKVKEINTIDDLADRKVYVRPGSSYAMHLKALSKRFIQQGGSAIKVVEPDQYLVTEDLLDLVNAGVFDISVADQHVAEAWAQVLPDIVVRPDIPVSTGGRIGWAVRKENPELLAHLNDFVTKNKKGSLMGNMLFKRYYQNSRWVKNPIVEQEHKKLQKLSALFKLYAAQYGFDWLAIAAQAYQESGLNQNLRSPAGAIGIMQVLPSTASDKAVNISDIHLVDNNIHAGVKYLNFLKNRYFSSPDIEPAARVNLSWAAYNAGPARINQLRSIAAKRGFDPNRWFFNVEKIAAEKIGRETVDYVANINKYYVAYRLYYDKDLQRRKSLESHSAISKD